MHVPAISTPGMAPIYVCIFLLTLITAEFATWCVQSGHSHHAYSRSVPPIYICIYLLTLITAKLPIMVGDVSDLVFSLGLSRAVLATPSLRYKSVTSASRDRGNISHDPTRDPSRDPSTIHTSRDLSARDPGNLRPRDPGKITHDLSRNWSSTRSPDKTHFERASNPLINTWQIVGTINKTHPLNNQRTCDATRSTKT